MTTTQKKKKSTTLIMHTTLAQLTEQKMFVQIYKQRQRDEYELNVEGNKPP